MITKTQYEILNKQRGVIDIMVYDGYMKNADGNWLQEMKSIYESIYNEPVNLNCGACIKIALTKVHDLLTDYEKANKP